MHVPDGFIDGPTSLAAAAIAAAGVGIAARRAGATLEERAVPLAGLTTAFVFAMQLVNVPVAAGTSGHLLGGALAAVLVGPAAAVVCLTVVVAAQCLFFADGGLTALGVNLVDMALLGPLAGGAAFALARRVLPDHRRGTTAAAAIAGASGMLAGVGGFVVFDAIGGTNGLAVGTVAAAMVGTHLVIAVLEAAITGAVVGAVLAGRPDLVRSVSPA